MTDFCYTARLFNAQSGHTTFMQAWKHAKAWLTAGHRLTVEVKQETRSSQQNRLLHALFADVARQAQWMGKKRTAAEWKVLFVSAHSVETKHGAEMIPGLAGEFVNIRESTARMSKARLNSLVEYVKSWCAMNDIELSDARQWMVDAETGEVLQ